MQEKTYVAIDLKSYYASVECVQRDLDPLGVNLVVADPTRTEKTICLAVSPTLKAWGISGRARLFEVLEKVKAINAERQKNAPGRHFSGKSFIDKELREDPSLELDFIIAPPQMRKYMQISAEIYDIYAKYVSPQDIHIYSVDEVFIDATQYLKFYKKTAEGFTQMLINAVLSETGITATAGIGSNLYLCKIAMDIVAKHIPPDENGVRIARLDEKSYRQLLWDHRPITDFWRVGNGTASKLASHGLYTMGDIARCSIGKPSDFHNEDLLYKLFGVNAELLIDHAWGWESCEISDIKGYKTENNSISSGQVLSEPYDFDMARLIVWEMTDQLVLDLVDKKLVTDQMVLTVGYDISNMDDPSIASDYSGEITTNHYGKMVPKQAHGSINLGEYTSSTELITSKVMQLYDEIVNPKLLVRRMYVVANRVIPEKAAEKKDTDEQLDMFTDYEQKMRSEKEKEALREKEKREQQAILAIKNRFGKNAIVKGANLQEGATAMERNGQVGGHKG